MQDVIKNINNDTKLKMLYENENTPENINNIIVFITNFQFSKQHPDLDIESFLYEVLKLKLNNKSSTEKNDFINLLKQKESEIVYNGESINLLTKNNNSIPFYQLIKMKLIKPIELFLESGYNISQRESAFILQKGLYGKIETSLLKNDKNVPDINSVWEALKKELEKSHNGIYNRDFKLMNNILHTIKKEDVFNLLEKEKEKDFLMPYFFKYNNKLNESSTFLQCIIKKDLNSIYLMLKNDFTLSIKEYALMYLPLLLDKKFFNEEKNFPNFYENREYIIQKLNTYPKEYKKELTVNIIKEIDSNFNPDIDILFGLRNIIIETLSEFTEREKFDVLNLKNTSVMPLFVSLINNKEDQSFYVKLFGAKETEIPRMCLKTIYKGMTNSSIYKNVYKDLLVNKIASFSFVEKESVINDLKSEKEKSSYELLSIIEKAMLEEKMNEIPFKEKKITKRI